MNNDEGGLFDEEVTFEADGLTLHGTYRHRDDDQSGPAALLISESGNTDRNGDNLVAGPIGTLFSAWSPPAALRSWTASIGSDSVRSIVRLGSILSVDGVTKLASCFFLSVMDSVHLGSSLSMRSPGLRGWLALASRARQAPRRCGLFRRLFWHFLEPQFFQMLDKSCQNLANMWPVFWLYRYRLLQIHFPPFRICGILLRARCR